MNRLITVFARARPSRANSLERSLAINGRVSSRPVDHRRPADHASTGQVYNFAGINYFYARFPSIGWRYHISWVTNTPCTS